MKPGSLRNDQDSIKNLNTQPPLPGGGNPTRESDNDDNQPGETSRDVAVETDADNDDVQGRYGRTVVHPDQERGDDPDDETAQNQSS